MQARVSEPPLCHITEDGGEEGFSPSKSTLKSTPGTHTKRNSAQLLFGPVYIPILWAQLFVPAGYTDWCG